MNPTNAEESTAAMELSSNKTHEKRNDNEKKSRLPSSSSAVSIFVDADAKAIGNVQKTQLQEPPVFKNPRALADASNKYETVDQNAQPTFKKKQHQKKKKSKINKTFETNTEKKNKNKNNKKNKKNGIHRNENPNPDSSTHPNKNIFFHHQHFNQHQYHHRHNYHSNRYETNKEYFAQCELAMADSNQMSFQPSFSGWTEESLGSFVGSQPNFAPQQQRHLSATIANTKDLFEPGSYSNDGDGFFHANSSNNNSNNNKEYQDITNDNDALARSCFGGPPYSWIDNIDANTRIDGLVLNNDGESKMFSIPPHVGALLLQEMLLHKESACHYGNSTPNNITASNDGEDKNRVGATSGFAPPHSNHHAPFFGLAPSLDFAAVTARFPPHPYSMYNGMMMQQQQPYNTTPNGCASVSAFPPLADGHGIHNVVPNIGFHPMMMQYQLYQQQQQQQQQHQPPPSTPGMQHRNAVHNPPPPEGLVIGVAHSHATAVLDDSSERDPIDRVRNEGYQYHATPHRLDAEPSGETPPHLGSAVAGDGNLRQRIDNHGNRALTPFRHPGRGGGIPPRRVSFSPMVSLPLSPVDDATTGQEEEEEEIVSAL